MTDTLMPGCTGVLVLANGTILQGVGCGAIGDAVGEVCFNTAMTGYQEILTDPSYMAQIIAFTFPHIGNVGTNIEDIEQFGAGASTAARGAIFRDVPTAPANWRSDADLDAWMKRRGVVGLAGVDTRALTKAIREHGMPHGVIAHSSDGQFDLDALRKRAAEWAGVVGLDLAKEATCTQAFTFDEGLWAWPEGYALKQGDSPVAQGKIALKQAIADSAGKNPLKQGDSPVAQYKYDVVVMDYGIKRNILRSLNSIGARVTVVPASTSAEDVLARNPNGVLLSNGPGDPSATGVYAAPEIRKLAESGTPVFGICLGHQMLALALGARTVKMEQGHHGANHPVKDLTTGKVEIVSMNHGFTVDRDSLPANVEETHVSLFDGTNAGIALSGKPVFSVQHHPEASPGPTDSLYLFDRFADLMDAAKA